MPQIRCLINHGMLFFLVNTDILDAIYPFHDERTSSPLVSSDSKSRSYDPRLRHQLIDGAPCRCPPACARTRYSASQSSAKFPNKASKLIREIVAEQSSNS